MLNPRYQLSSPVPPGRFDPLWCRCRWRSWLGTCDRPAASRCRSCRAETPACSRRADHLADQVDRRPHPDAGADPDHESVVVVDHFRGSRVGVVGPDRLDIERAVGAQLARDHDTQRWRVAVLEVVGPVNRRNHAQADGLAGLLPDVVLQELDRAVAGAVDAGLPAAHQPKRYSRPITPPSRGRRSSARLPKSPCPSGRVNRCVTRNALEARQAQRRRQRDREIRL